MEKTISLLKQYLVGLALLFFSLAFALFIIGYWALLPHLEAGRQATAVARQVAQLQQTQQVERYSGEVTYYSVYGQDQENQAVIVSVNQETGQVYITPQAKGLSREQAVAKAQENGADRINKTVFGRYQDRPIWEVKSGSAYYLIDFASGDLVKKEGV